MIDALVAEVVMTEGKKEKKYLYELASDAVCLPVYVNQNGKTYTLFVRMKAFEFTDYKKMMSNITVTRERNDKASFSELNAADSEQIRNVATDHFLELHGIESPDGKQLDEEKQKLFLSRRPTVTEMIGLYSFANVSTPEQLIPNGHLVFDFDEGDSQEIVTEVDMADWAEKKDIALSITHTMRVETEADRIVYRKLTKVRTSKDGKREFSWNVTNYDSVNRLYDSMALSVTGTVINGALCSESNRKDWISRIPLPWKLWVLNEIFNRVELKKG